MLSRSLLDVSIYRLNLIRNTIPRRLVTILFGHTLMLHNALILFIVIIVGLFSFCVSLYTFPTQNEMIDSFRRRMHWSSPF